MIERLVITVFKGVSCLIRGLEREGSSFILLIVCPVGIDLVMEQRVTLFTLPSSYTGASVCPREKEVVSYY